MEQTSRLSIVVDTRNAETQLKKFNASLRASERSGDRFNATLAKITNGSDFGRFNQSVLNTNYHLGNLVKSATNAASSLKSLSSASRELKGSTTGIAKNLNAINTAANSTAKLSKAMGNARVNTSQFRTQTKGVSTDVSKLNTTLKTGVTAINNYSQAAVTAGQRLVGFGRAATQLQTRLRGLDSGIASMRGNMSSLVSSANSINAIFGNLDRTMARLSAATNRLSDASLRASQQINRLDREFGGANTRARGFMGTINSLQGLLSGGLITLSGIGVLKTADEMQNLNSQIRIVTNSEEELLAVREKVRAIADKNFNDVAATTDLYQKSARALANLGKSQQEAVMFTDAVSLAMRTGGRSAQEQASAILQLGQAMGAGALMGDEFRSISENAPILLELVSKRMGVLPGQLKELASEGKITSEIMYDAFSQNIDLLEDMATKIPLTMGQAFTRARNQYKKYVDGMMNDTDGMSSVIANAITGIGNNFDNIAKGAVAIAGLAFLQFAGTVNASAKAMALFNLVMKANPLVLVATAAIAVSTAFYDFGEVMGVTGIVFGDLYNVVTTGLKGISDLAWAVSFNISQAISDSNDKNNQSFTGFFDNTQNGFTGLLQGIGRVVAAATSTLAAFFQTIGAGAANLFKSLTNGFTWVFNKVGSISADIVNEVISNINSAIGFIDRLTIKANDALSFFNSPLKFKMIGQIEYRASSKDTPLLLLNNKTFSDRIGDNMGTLMPIVDNYFSSVASRYESKNASKEFDPLSTDPMDLLKKAQYDQIKATNALAAANEAAAKSAKERAKSERSVELVRKAVLGGKDWGISQGGQFGGSRGHNGIDIPTPKGTQVFAPEAGTIKTYGTQSSRGGKQLILTTDSGKKYGFAHLDSYDVSNGQRVDAGFGIAKTGNSGTRPSGKGYSNHLHLTVTDINGKKVDPTKLTTGKPSYDATVGSYNAKLASEAQKAIEIARKEAERINKVRLDLVKQYGDAESRLAVEHGERIEKIREGNLGEADTNKLIAQSKERMDRELAVYENGLQKQVDALDAFQQTKTAMLARERDAKRFDLQNDIELSRSENSELLQLALDSVDAEYEYKLEQHELALKKQKNELTEYQKTERQIIQSGWDAKIADAVRATDELKVIRVASYVEQAKRELEIFDANQELKLLELNKTHMTELAYIREKYRLESELIGLSNESPDVKAAQLRSLKAPSKEALKDMLGGIEQESPLGKIQAEYEERLAVIEQYEQMHTDMIGVQTEARLAVEKSYMDAKRDLMLTQGEALFGDLAGMAKAFAGEQSGIYRALFAVEKGFAIAQSAIAIQQSIAKAMALGFPQNIPVIGQAVSQGASLMSNIKGITAGFKQGGYTGNMGVNQVAGVVHGQEYVFDAQATKRIGVDNLNAMRSGKAPTGDVSINIINNSSAKVTASDDGKTITITDVRNEVKRGFTELQNPNSHNAKMVKSSFNTTTRR